MADLQKTAVLVGEIGGLVAAILAAIPGAQGAAALEGLLSQLASKALLAYQSGLGVEITPESVRALLPDPTPLVDPKTE